MSDDIFLSQCITASLTIAEEFDPKLELSTILSRLGFSVNAINRLINDKGLKSATEIFILRPKELSYSLEAVNNFFGNSTCTNDEIYISHAQILKLKAFCV